MTFVRNNPLNQEANPMSKRQTRRRRSGFTLMEIMLVLAILVVLASGSVFAYQSIRKRAFIRAATTQVDSLKARTNEYFDAYGVYPSNLECLYDATQDDNQARDPNEKFIDGPLQPDPWGNPYQIELIGDEVRITCWGPDGQVGSEDDISR